MSATVTALRPAVLSHSRTNSRAGTGTNLKPPTARLDTAIRVRRELARLYSEARAGAVDVADASKLANILQILGRMIEAGDLEERISALEKRAETKK